MMSSVRFFTKVFRSPDVLTHRTLKCYLQMAEPIFKMKNLRIENVAYDLSRVTSMNILGALMVYKFMDYTVKNACFKLPHFIIDKKNKYVEKQLQKLGFWELVNSFMINKPANYNELKYEEKKDLFIAPIALDREVEDDASDVVCNKICNYYKYNSAISFAVTSCIIEVLSNFAAHAETETKSVLVASGNKQKFEMACADSGVGVVSSLRKIVSKENRRFQSYEILQRSIERGVSSKSSGTGHMGYGLWLVGKLVEICNGEMYLVSEGAYILMHGGKIKNGKCAYWKGTIVYLSLQLQDEKIIRNSIHELRIELNKMKK